MLSAPPSLLVAHADASWTTGLPSHDRSFMEGLRSWDIRDEWSAGLVTSSVEDR